MYGSEEDDNEKIEDVDVEDVDADDADDADDEVDAVYADNAYDADAVDDADADDDDRPWFRDIVLLGGGHILSGQVLGVDCQLLIFGADLRLASCWFGWK